MVVIGSCSETSEFTELEDGWSILVGVVNPGEVDPAAGLLWEIDDRPVVEPSGVAVETDADGLGAAGEDDGTPETLWELLLGPLEEIDDAGREEPLETDSEVLVARLVSSCVALLVVSTYIGGPELVSRKTEVVTPPVEVGLLIDSVEIPLV